MKFDWKEVLKIILLFVAVRLILGVWMWGVRQVLPASPPASTSDPYAGISIEGNPWLEPWQRWDTPQYQAIAERGYNAFPNALFTPPLFPFLMKWTAPIFNGNTLASGLVISGIAFLACLLAVYQTAQLEFKNEKDAFRTTLYLASFPTAFFLSAAYSESIFIVAAVLCLYFAFRSKWLAAGLWGGVAAFTRTPGVFLIFPLAFIAYDKSKLKDWHGWFSPALTGVGAIIFPSYVWFGLNRSPVEILDALNARGGHLSIPGWNLVIAISRILHGQLIEENLIELAFSLLFIILTVFIWIKLPRIYGIYSVTLMVLFLSRLGSPQPLVSMARYVIEIFPAFFILAIWGRKPWINRLILYLSWFGLLFFSAQFAIWGWVG